MSKPIIVVRPPSNHGLGSSRFAGRKSASLRLRLVRRSPRSEQSIGTTGIAGGFSTRRQRCSCREPHPGTGCPAVSQGPRSHVDCGRMSRAIGTACRDEQYHDVSRQAGPYRPDAGLPLIVPGGTRGRTGRNPPGPHRSQPDIDAAAERSGEEALGTLTGIGRRFETNSPQLQQMLLDLEVAARHDVTILLIGETGAGRLTFPS